MFWNWSDGGGQRFSKCSENQKCPNYPMGGWGQFKFGKIPKFSRFFFLMASLRENIPIWIWFEWILWRGQKSIRTKSHRQINFVVHLRSNSQQKFQCADCDYKVTQEGNLATHLKSMHRGQPFCCLESDYKDTQKRSLATHLTSLH